MAFPRIVAGLRGNNSITRPSEIMVIDDVQDVLPVFGTPSFKIILLRISSQINKTTLAASQTSKRLFHNLYLLTFTSPFYSCPRVFWGLFKNVQTQGAQKPNREAYIDIR
jgi:hypothetical protein